MCTVTFLPINSTSFILTHNRDEHHTRSVALLPEKKVIHEVEIVSPKDEQGGGTWLAMSTNFSLCLLNGGFEKHQSQPPYKHSRGLIILDFFKFNHIESFVKEYDFNGLEPFTLILIQHHEMKVNEIVFDGHKTFHSIKNSHESHIWSSSTLYSLEDKMKRMQWFANWKKKHVLFSQNEIISFHEYKGEHDSDEGFIINRNEKLLTVSLSSVMRFDDGRMDMLYKDFIEQKQIKVALD